MIRLRARCATATASVSMTFANTSNRASDFCGGFTGVFCGAGPKASVFPAFKVSTSADTENRPAREKTRTFKATSSRYTTAICAGVRATTIAMGSPKPKKSATMRAAANGRSSENGAAGASRGARLSDTSIASGSSWCPA